MHPANTFYLLKITYLFICLKAFKLEWVTFDGAFQCKLSNNNRIFDTLKI